MCSGRVDLEFIIRAFLNGQDGVFVGGCKLDECNYITHGNYDALSTVTIAKKILAYIGLNPDRLRLQFMSAADGNLLAEVTDKFSSVVKAIGPFGRGEREESDAKMIKLKLEVAKKIVPYIRLVERERLRIPQKSRAAYEAFYTSEQFDALFEELIVSKLAICQITTLLKEKALSTGEIAAALGLNPSEVSRHMNNSSRYGFVRYDVQQKCYALA